MKDLRLHEPGGAHSPPPVRIDVFPGRSFVFSPEWRDDGLSVLFDRNSGDYWVVSALARKIVETISQPEGPVPLELGSDALSALSNHVGADATHDMARSVVDELLRLDILRSIPTPEASTLAGHPLD